MTKKDTNNCLSSSLRQWERDSSLVLYYNSDHVINLMPYDAPPKNYLPLSEYGMGYFLSAFGEMLSDHCVYLLSRYFYDLYRNQQD